MKGVAIFLDDQLYPPDGGRRWVLIRSAGEAIDYVLEHGIPSFVSFDTDLSEYADGQHLCLNGEHFATWLTDRDLDTGEMPDDFAFTVHSPDGEGVAVIFDTLTAHLNYRQEQRLAGKPWPPDIQDGAGVKDEPGRNPNQHG